MLNRSVIRNWLADHNWSVQRLAEECSVLSEDTIPEGTMRNAVNGIDPIRRGRALLICRVTAKYGDGLSYEALTTVETLEPADTAAVASPAGTARGVDRAAAFRDAMVDKLCADGVITSSRVERAFRVVPRHRFVPDGTPLDVAYDPDRAVPVTRGQDGVLLSAVSAPVVQARMLTQAELVPNMTVLEIGPAGYTTALLAELVGPGGRVVSVDADAEAATRARVVLEETGYGEWVTVVRADAEQRVPELDEPADTILVTVEAWDIPPAWLEQLDEDGMLVVPLRMNGVTRSIGFVREDDHLVSESVEPCEFVPIPGCGARDEHTYRLGDVRGPGVTLRFDDALPPGLHRLDGALAAEPAEVWSGFAIPREKPFADLSLWFASFLPGFCTLAVHNGPDNEANDAALLDAGDTWWFPYGAVREDSLTYLVTQPTTEGGGIEFGARAHGPHAKAAASAMVTQVWAWADHWFDDDPAPRFAYWPTGTRHPEPAQRTVVLPKTHGVVTISWPEPHPTEPREYVETGAGSAPYVRNLTSLLSFFVHYPMNSTMSLIAMTPDPIGEIETVIELADTPFPGIVTALDEWAFTLADAVMLIRRARDGDTVDIGVRGRSDCDDTPIQVWSRPIPYHQLIASDIDVDVQAGTTTELDAELLHQWATIQHHRAHHRAETGYVDVQQ